MKRTLFLSGQLVTGGCFLFSLPLAAQDASGGFKLVSLIPWGIALAGLLFGLYQYKKRFRDEVRKEMVKLQTQRNFKEDIHAAGSRTGEELYRAALKEELGYIAFLGSPDLDSCTVKLEDTFVSLSISQTWRSEDRFAAEGQTRPPKTEPAGEKILSPEQVMTHAFQRHRILLVIGDPGSGKTTLMKYYALRCLDKTQKRYRQLGFSSPVFPIYFPLRELEFDAAGHPVSLPENLRKRADRHLLNLSEEHFVQWLRERDTLVLLDGLDEISSLKGRRRVCRWIKDLSIGLKRACIVVTSRATGYRKLDGVELQWPHLRADIMDFSPSQQEEYLEHWFLAAFTGRVQQVNQQNPGCRDGLTEEARRKAQGIINFLKSKENQAVRELAAVPMLLEIMAVLWKDRQLLPKTRAALYEAALNYLLEYRSRVKDIDPLVSSDEARRVLAPAALWMQEELKSDEVDRTALERYLQPLLDTLDNEPGANTFCKFLRDRAGLIADYDREHYIFRHKSFREFLAGLQLREIWHESGRLEDLARVFTDPWWEETLRFFMCKSNPDIFDGFMKQFFGVPANRDLNAHHRKLLLQMVEDAPQKRIDALVEWLNYPELPSGARQVVMDCLKTIGTPRAFEAIKGVDSRHWDRAGTGYALDIVKQWEAAREPTLAFEIIAGAQGEPPSSYRNPFESNVEYIRIPGRTFTYSVTQKQETAGDFYLCKYPVTNARYRRFTDYLSGKEKEFSEILPLERFSPLLLEFAGNNTYDGVIADGFLEHLGKAPSQWKEKFRSGEDGNKKFNGADQPVVAISWYAARSYCFWLSCLEAAVNNKEALENTRELSAMYRLPNEMEWEWAAGGNPDGSVREYPWSKDKGKPTPELANYDGNVGTTTPVGNYPGGATPQGLLDMAGNVWEWMDNYYDNDKDFPVLRGGSWSSLDDILRCSARLNYSHPHLRYYYVGLRPLRPSPLF